MVTEFELPYWYDLHTHLRQDDLLPVTIQAQLDMGCCGVLAMPNTKPPVAKVFKNDALEYESIEAYYEQILRAGGEAFEDIIIPLYITKDTSAAMIDRGAKSGLLRAVKYYPPHGTTGADFSYPFEALLKTDIFKALEANDIVLCVHGEEHDLSNQDYLDCHKNAEKLFYEQRLPELVDACPSLRIVAEHITTKQAVNFVKQAGAKVKGSITPQHLLYTLGDLIRGLRYHLYCLPVLKFDEDRAALREAVTDMNNQDFFAGTDSAPHTHKATDCGCAAGCFTGGVAPQLYAQAFEEAGLVLDEACHQTALKRFLCDIGPGFYGLKPASKSMRLRREPGALKRYKTAQGSLTTLPEGLGQASTSWTLLL